MLGIPCNQSASQALNPMAAKKTPGTTSATPSLRSHSAPIIERAPLPIVELQGSTHIVSYVNPAFCRLLGKSREEIIWKSFADIVHGGDQCVPMLDRVYQTGEAATLVQEDGSDPASASWLYAMWPALDANEKPVGVIIQLAKTSQLRRDAIAVNEALLIAGLRQHELAEEAKKLNAQLQSEITERKQGDGARALLATIVEHSDDAIISKDLKGTIATWNRGAERLFGYSAEEAIGQPITMLFPPDRLGEEAGILAGVRSGKPVKPYETVRRRKDGTLVNVSLSVSPLRDVRGEIVGASKIVRDISERKRAEEVQARLGAIVSSADDGILSKTLDGIVSTWNASAERLFGYTAEEI
ncbi:MAG: PAS domain S-box protein, partial [Chthoniobacteraceae bacterium]